MRKSRYEQALQRAVARFRRQPNVVGLLVVGSYATGQMDKTSDIDLYVVVRDQDWRERGNLYFDGVEVEYFVNPVEQIQAYFEQELRSTDHGTIEMFAHGRILYDPHGIIAKLVRKARRLSGSRPPPLKHPRRWHLRYGVLDRLKDLEDTLARHDRLAFQLVRQDLTSWLVREFFHVARLPQPKLKRIEPVLGRADPRFLRFLRGSIAPRASLAASFRHLRRLAHYFLDLLGAVREPHRLRGPLQLKEGPIPPLGP